MEIAVLSTSRSGHNFIIEMIKSWLPGVKIQKLENAIPEDLHYHQVGGKKKLIVIRDFKNFLASSLKALTSASPWRENIEGKINAYRLIKEEAKHPKYYIHSTVIYYDKFVKDRKYREALCKELGGEYTEEKLNYVPNEGNGSSFNGFELQGKGSEMATRDRHKEILKTEWANIYKDLLEQNKDLW